MAEAVEHIIVETPEALVPASQPEIIEAVAEAEVAVIEARSEAAVAEIEAAGEAAVAVAEVIEAQKDEQWQTLAVEMGALSERIATLETSAAETLALVLSIRDRLPPPPNPPPNPEAEIVAVVPVEPAVLTENAAAAENPSPNASPGRPRHVWR
jgi:hypothetical protein